MSTGNSTLRTTELYEKLPKESFKHTIGAGDEAAKSESSGNDLHDDCEWIDTANVMMILV